MNNLNVVVSGCGNVARHAHCPAWLAVPGAEISALVDPDAGAIARLRDKCGIAAPAFACLEDALDRVRADIVDICSPGFAHFEQAALALNAGCHVLIEKPPVYSVAAGVRLCRMAARRGLQTGVMLNYRYRDLILRLKQAADEGLLGRLVKVNITHHGPLVFGDAPWLWDESRSKYLLWEFAIHFLDLLVFLLGPAEDLIYVHPERSPALGHTTDLEVAVRFRSGAAGRLEITADTTRHSSLFTRVDAFGTAQDAFLRWFPPSLRFQAGVGSPLAILAEEFKAVSFVGWKLLRGEFTQYRNISHQRAIAAFVDSIRGGPEYPLALARILPTIELVSNIEERVPSYHAQTTSSVQSG